MQKAKPGYNLVKWLFGKEIEIPEDWEVKKFEDIAKIRRGASPRPIEDPKYFGNGRGWIRISDVSKSKKYLKQTRDFLSTLGESKSVAVDEGDVILSIAASVGKPIIIKMKACIHDGFITFTNMQNIMNNEFLYYLLLKTKTTFTNMGQHGTQSNINSEIVSKTKFLNPPKHEQQKIAAILSNIDNLIDSFDKTIESTKKLKKELMQTLLTKGIGHKKFKKVPWLFGKEIEIPEEWELEKLGENSTLKGRIGWQGLTTKEYREKGEFYLVTGTDFKKGKIDWENCVFVDKDRFDQDLNIQLKNDDVLITKDGTIGKIAVVDKHLFPATLNTGVCVVRPIEKKYLPLILYYILNSNYFLKFLNRFKGGSTINHLYQKDFVKFSFPIPSLSEQKKIASMLSSVDEKITKLESKKKSAESLKKGLMQKLLTGQIRVKA